MLKLQRKDKPQDDILVAEKLYSIGSANNNNLILNESGIDPLHARLITHNGKVTVKDNTSTLGCFVNGQRVTQKLLRAGDVLRLANAEFVIHDYTAAPSAPTANNPCWQLVADGSWLIGQTFTITPGARCILGRNNDCDITIAGTHLSRQHAELSVVGGSLRVRDLNTTNGTYLNDRLIQDELAHNGDQLRVDVYSFRVISPEHHAPPTQVRPRVSIIGRAIERKDIGRAPKRWKTKPTSPGNRHEPTPPTAPRWRLWVGIGVAALLAVALSAGIIFSWVL
jgi:pSer/pThr/pTyr-binding forkhead associated (FHA) protein